MQDDHYSILLVYMVPLVLSLGNEFVNLTELRRLDISNATELLAADIARQSRIHRRRDAVRIVVCGRREQVVHSQKAAVGGADIADIEAHVRRQLTLDVNRALPVVSWFVYVFVRLLRSL